MQDFISKEKYLAIIINEPNNNNIVLREDVNRLDTLYIKTYDLDDIEISKKYNYQILTREDAHNIIDFITKYSNKCTNIAISCDAGISRSAAVGGAILKIFTGNDKEIMESSKFVPNKLFYNIILEAAKERGFL